MKSKCRNMVRSLDFIKLIICTHCHFHGKSKIYPDIFGLLPPTARLNRLDANAIARRLNVFIRKLVIAQTPKGRDSFLVTAFIKHYYWLLPTRRTEQGKEIERGLRFELCSADVAEIAAEDKHETLQ